MKVQRTAALALVFLLVTLSGCKSPGGKSAGVVPIMEALAAGRSPVEVGSPVPMLVSPVAPTFEMTVKNITDAPLDSISWTAVAFDENGKPIPEGEVEGGYADPLDPLAAGEARELSFMISLENAASVKLVLKDVIYRAPNPVDKKLGDLAYKWTNPYYDAELQKARGIAVPD